MGLFEVMKDLRFWDNNEKRITGIGVLATMTFTFIGCCVSVFTLIFTGCQIRELGRSNQLQATSLLLQQRQFERQVVGSSAKWRVGKSRRVFEIPDTVTGAPVIPRVGRVAIPLINEGKPTTVQSVDLFIGTTDDLVLPILAPESMWELREHDLETDIANLTWYRPELIAFQGEHSLYSRVECGEGLCPVFDLRQGEEPRFQRRRTTADGDSHLLRHRYVYVVSMTLGTGEMVDFSFERGPSAASRPGADDLYDGISIAIRDGFLGSEARWKESNEIYRQREMDKSLKARYEAPILPNTSTR